MKKSPGQQELLPAEHTTHSNNGVGERRVDQVSPLGQKGARVKCHLCDTYVDIAEEVVHRWGIIGRKRGRPVFQENDGEGIEKVNVCNECNPGFTNFYPQICENLLYMGQVTVQQPKEFVEIKDGKPTGCCVDFHECTDKGRCKIVADRMTDATERMK